MESPDKLAIIVKENNAIAKYSKGVNLSANFAKLGEININAKILIIPPIKEYNIPAPRALPASPLSAIGPPSRTVAIDDGVPGILSNIADISPPDIPPMYKPINNEIPFIGVIPKDMGRNKTTAMVADNPGMDPKIIPTITPNVISIKHIGDVITAKTPSIIISFSFLILS
jgi:hypothetical protein